MNPEPGRSPQLQLLTVAIWALQGYLAHKKTPPPLDRRKTIGVGLLQGPMGRRFLMSEVPLYRREVLRPRAYFESGSRVQRQWRVHACCP